MCCANLPSNRSAALPPLLLPAERHHGYGSCRHSQGTRAVLPAFRYEQRLAPRQANLPLLSLLLPVDLRCARLVLSALPVSTPVLRPSSLGGVRARGEGISSCAVVRTAKAGRGRGRRTTHRHVHQELSTARCRTRRALAAAAIEEWGCPRGRRAARQAQPQCTARDPSPLRGARRLDQRRVIHEKLWVGASRRCRNKSVGVIAFRTCSSCAAACTEIIAATSEPTSGSSGAVGAPSVARSSCRWTRAWRLSSVARSDWWWCCGCGTCRRRPACAARP